MTTRRTGSAAPAAKPTGTPAGATEAAAFFKNAAPAAETDVARCWTAAGAGTAAAAMTTRRTGSAAPAAKWATTGTPAGTTEETGSAAKAQCWTLGSALSEAIDGGLLYITASAFSR
jgi:hypothetical protein